MPVTMNFDSHQRIQVKVAHLTDTDWDRIVTVTEELVEELPDHLSHYVFVSVRESARAKAYVRAAPGATQAAKLLGKEFFDLFGALVGVGFQVHDDWNRPDLTGSQKLGRASLALLGSAVPPIGYAMLGASIVFPRQYDRFTAGIFSNDDPLVAGLSDIIVKVGGRRFEDWSVRPCWIDFF